MESRSVLSSFFRMGTRGRQSFSDDNCLTAKDKDQARGKQGSRHDKPMMSTSYICTHICKRILNIQKILCLNIVPILTLSMGSKQQTGWVCSLQTKQNEAWAVTSSMWADDRKPSRHFEMLWIEHFLFDLWRETCVGYLCTNYTTSKMTWPQ